MSRKIGAFGRNQRRPGPAIGHLQRARVAGLATACVAAAVGVAACGNSTAVSTSSGSSSAASSTKAPLKSILFVNPLPNYPAWREIGDCMKAQANKDGISFTQAGPAGGTVDSQSMLNSIQQGIADKVSAIVTYPVSGPQFNPVLRQARSAGLYVATVEGAGSTSAQNVDVGTSYDQFGKMAAETIAKKPGTQYIGFITTSGTPPASTFVKAFTAEAKHFSNIKIVSSEFDNGNPTDDVDLATDMMTAHPTLNMFVTNEGAATPGIIAAIKAAKKVGKTYLTTNSIYSGAEAGIKDGIVYSTLLQNMCGIGTIPVQALKKLSQGQTVPSYINSGIRFATKSTLTKDIEGGKYQ